MPGTYQKEKVAKQTQGGVVRGQEQPEVGMTHSGVGILAASLEKQSRG